MTKKVLIAEDSQTVQKVIGFTLENEPFELVNSPDEKSLFSNLEKGSFDLVALDMSLSEKKSGYDLVREIKLKYPKVAVLSLFGTFDAIDEKAFKNSGADEKIIKPFDSVEFVSKCKKLTNISEKVAEKVTEAPADFENVSEEWQLEAPKMEEKQESIGLDLESWGMDIPGIIETPSVPDESLLEEGAKLLSTMSQSLDEEEEELDQAPLFEEPNLEFPEIVSKSVTPEPKIQKEDIKETAFDFSSAMDEEITPEEFWAVDTESMAQPKMAMEPKVAPSQESQKIPDELMESLRPLIEEYIRKYCQQIAEKVAWEVIPDLAENLIKKEIKEISKSLD